MPDQRPTPGDRDSNVVRLQWDSGSAQLRGGRVKRSHPTWLTDHVRNAIGDVDGAGLGSTQTAPLVAPAPLVEVPVAAPPARPWRLWLPIGGPIADHRRRVLVAGHEPHREHSLRHLRVAAERLIDRHMGIRRVRAAAALQLGWRSRVARVAVAVVDPALALAPLDIVTMPVLDIAPALPTPAVVAEPAPPLPFTPDPPVVAIVETEPIAVVAAPAPPTEIEATPEPLVAPVEIAPAMAPVAPTVVVNVAAPALRRRRQSGWSYTLGLISAALGSLATVISIAIVASVLMGYHEETVVTGSMVPTVPVGSMVLSQKTPVNNLKVGDVIVFPRPVNPNVTNQPSETIVHRIVAVKDTGDGNLEFTTKGDANGSPDCWAPPACPIKNPKNVLADKVVYVLPGMGNVAVLVREIAILLIVFIAAVIVLGWAVRQIRRQLQG